MATNIRIYTVTDSNGAQRLVRTYSQAAAIAHVARTVLKASVSTADELVGLTKAGVEVETPTSEAATPEADDAKTTDTQEGGVV